MQLDLLDLPEDEFLRALGQIITQEGRLGAVLYLMIMYNVPLFVLSRIWPQKHAEFFESPAFIAFCIAEDGWKGRIGNIASQTTLDSSPDSSKPNANETYSVHFQKSYVVGPKPESPEAANQIILVVSKFNESFALNWIPRSPKEQVWDLRTEPHTEFGKEKFPYHHYRVSGQYKAAPYNVQLFEKSNYRRLGLEIPGREFTSLGYLAGSLVSYYEPLPSLIQEARGKIVDARRQGKVTKEAWAAAQNCVDHLAQRAAAEGWPVHPLWHKLGMYQRK